MNMTKYNKAKAVKLTPELAELWEKAHAAYKDHYGASLTFQRHAEQWIERGCKEILRDVERKKRG